MEDKNLQDLKIDDIESSKKTQYTNTFSIIVYNLSYIGSHYETYS